MEPTTNTSVWYFLYVRQKEEIEREKCEEYMYRQTACWQANQLEWSRRWERKEGKKQKNSKNGKTEKKNNCYGSIQTYNMYRAMKRQWTKWTKKKKRRFHEKDICVLAWRLGYLFACLLDCCWYTTLTGLYILSIDALRMLCCCYTRQTNKQNVTRTTNRAKKKCTTEKYVSLYNHIMLCCYIIVLAMAFLVQFFFLFHSFWFHFFRFSLASSWYIW